MTQQKNSQLASQNLSSKLVLPHGTAESATIEVSIISSVRVVKSDAGWTIKISLKSGQTVDVPYSQANVDVLESYVTASYPDGHPGNDHGAPTPDLDLIDGAHAAAPEMDQTDKAASGTRLIKLEEFSKLAAPMKEKMRSKPAKVGEKKKPK
jgi:hypothetical protein